MSETAQSLDLPRDYELVVSETLADTLAEATRLARAGAEEGTLIWTQRQRSAPTPAGEPWLSSDGDLHCALLLRPEFDVDTALQLAIVALASLGATVAELASPMTTLHYRWPNELLLRNGKAGAVRVAGDIAADRFDWLALAVDLNVRSTAQAVSFNGAALQPDGECEADCEQVLGRYSRHFLRAINNWAETGFSPILDAWLRRVPDLGQYVAIRGHGATVEGVLRRVHEHGAAEVVDDQGEVRMITLREFFGFDGLAV